jgi:hypothetical protein
VGHVAYNRKLRNLYKILVGKSDGKKNFWNLGGHGGYDIKMYLIETDYGVILFGSG